MLVGGNKTRLGKSSCPPKMANCTADEICCSSSCEKHDVFISFRGEDTRNNFTSHLHAAFDHNNIQTFIDYRIPKGDEISPSILKAINGSNVSVVVLSKDYASSTWCLRELAQILEHKKRGGHFVVPVFYKVDPSHVRNQTDTYKKAFEKHKRDIKHNMSMLQNWKAALTEVANLVGWESRNFRTEYELIEEIVKDVMQKLNHIYPTEEKCLVGINHNLAPIESLLRIGSREVRIIGIWGMGGIGKTTIANALFDKLSSQYEGSCFLANVREEFRKQRPSYLRDKLLSEVLEDEKLHVSTPTRRSTFVLRRLSRKKVLIVLDDVDNAEKLEYLAAKHDCLGPGSRVIVTTRDKHVLSKGVDEIFEVKGLPLHHAVKLFSKNAFNQNFPKMGFEMLSKMAVDHANGNPLALKVLGSVLHSRNEQQWGSALRKLMKFPNAKIQNVLRWSYDGLDDEEKNMFLDIACFLRGENQENVIRLLDICGFFADIGVRILQDKALITISDVNDEVCMHDLIQEMGWEIVHQECIKDPGRRSRLWDPEEVYDVLKNNRGTDAVEGIVLDVSQIRELPLSYETFSKMVNIRFLKFYMGKGRTSNLLLPWGLESLSNKLKYLHWDGYPSKFLPSNFCPHNLVVLSMMGSHVEKLWDGIKSLPSLKEINLCGCKNLINLPDLSLVPNLETIDLSHCTSLLHVPSSIQYINKLLLFNLESCKKLNSLPSIHLFSLKMFILKGCSSLDEFSVTSANMMRLDLRGTAIENFPELVWQHLNQLVYLNLGSCNKLKSLKSSIHLSSLQRLNLEDCSSLEVFSVTSKNMEYLNLGGTSIKELPASIWRNNKLFTLVLRYCKRLVSFPDRPKLDKLPQMFNEPYSSGRLHMEEPWTLSSLVDLSLKGSSIENLPASFKELPSLKKLTLARCKKLQSLPSLPSSLEDLSLDESKIECLPVSIKDLSHLKKLTLVNHKKLLSQPELPQSLKTTLLNESIIDSCLMNKKDLSHLQKLPLTKWKRFHYLPELPQFLEEFSLNESNIECIPVSFKNLSHLRKLALIKCERLQYLPELPPSLEDFSINGCNIESLPISIKDLPLLQKITLIECQRLREVPELPPCLQLFCAADCRSLEIVQSSKTILIQDRHAFYYNCINLDHSSRNNIIADAPFEAAFTSLRERTPLGPLISICLPGTEIPDWFSYQTASSSLDIEIPQQWLIDSKFLGFALCLVVGGFQQNSYEGYDPDVNCYHFVKSACNSDLNVPFLGHCTTVMHVPRSFHADHIYICYYPAFNVSILQDFKDLAKYYDANNLKLRVIFKFKGPSQRLDIVKKCGVRPLLIANTEKLHAESELQPEEDEVSK